jgi:hypothetical protein
MTALLYPSLGLSYEHEFGYLRSALFIFTERSKPVDTVLPEAEVFLLRSRSVERCS